MRLDLIVNTMFKSAIRDRSITVNNPSIWRPILSIEDASTAYIRAIEANERISGVFNIASGNHTVGEVADLVKSAIGERLDFRVSLDLKHIQDFRNYKVSIEKAANVLSFHPAGSVRSIVDNLIENMDKSATGKIVRTPISRYLRRSIRLPKSTTWRLRESCDYRC